ncbi:MAG: hypothetical protein IT424_11670 [Pirellulales bacterium]|nr:hypothetical protein [Pirellulales bacterium]
MKLDPVLAEIRATRAAFSERFHGDIDAMLADLRLRQAEGGRKSVRLPPQRLTAAELAAPTHRATAINPNLATNSIP